MLAYDKALWRRRETLDASRAVLDDAWGELTAHRRGEGLGSVAARETAAMTAAARWCVAAASTREESRGMHSRTDAPETRPETASRLLVGGLDEVWTRYEHQPARSPEVEPAL